MADQPRPDPQGIQHRHSAHRRDAGCSAGKQPDALMRCCVVGHHGGLQARRNHSRHRLATAGPGARRARIPEAPPQSTLLRLPVTVTGRKSASCRRMPVTGRYGSGVSGICDSSPAGPVLADAGPQPPIRLGQHPRTGGMHKPRFPSSLARPGSPGRTDRTRQTGLRTCAPKRLAPAALRAPYPAEQSESGEAPRSGMRCGGVFNGDTRSVVALAPFERAGTARI